MCKFDFKKVGQRLFSNQESLNNFVYVIEEIQRIGWCKCIFEREKERERVKEIEREENIVIFNIV